MFSEARITAGLNRLARRRAATRVPVAVAAGGGSWAAAGLLAALGVRGLYHPGDARARETTERTVMALAASYVVVAGIGRFIARPRPFAAHVGTVDLIGHPGDRSFPSRHVASATAMAVIAWPTYRRLGLTYATIALALAVSRVAAGLHYPSDALGGAVVGWLVGRLARIGMSTR